MTTNQLKFAELQENKRHNLATEFVASGSLSESSRHNVETERTNWYSAQQSAAIGWGQVANQATANENLRRFQEGQLINQEKITAETGRHNLYVEGTYPSQILLNEADARKRQYEVELINTQQKWHGFNSFAEGFKDILGGASMASEAVRKWMPMFSGGGSAWGSPLLAD